MAEIEVDVVDTENKVVGKLKLRDGLFGLKPNRSVLHQYVVMYLANRRRGRAATKTRAEVRGGGIKPWRQKGTGRARVGSIRSPLWRGGGTVFGPHPRNYSFSLPKKVKLLALKSALSDKAQNRNIIVLDGLRLSEAKTKVAWDMLKRLGVEGGRVLLVSDDEDGNVKKSVRNLPQVNFSLPDVINAYMVLDSDKLLITRSALGKVEEVFAADGEHL
jgi:large subunit ribosomal protein L4